MADDKKFDAEGALASGVSEDQVLDYLSKTRPYDVQGAIKAGASKRSIIDYLSGAEVHKEKGDFWSKYWDTVSGPVKGAGLALKGAVEASKGPGAAFTSPEGQQTAKDLYSGFVEPQVDMFKEAWEAAKQGQLVKAGARTIEGLMPGVGPAIAEGGKLADAGDESGALGTWAGVLTTMAAPRIAGKVAGKVLPPAAEGVYRGGLSLEKRVPLEDRPQIVARGLGREVDKAAGEKPASGTAANKKGLGDIEKRVSDTKPRQMSEIKNVTNAGVKTIHRAQIEQPLQELRAEFEDAASPERVKMIDKMLDDLRKRYPHDLLSADEVQRFKEATDKILTSKAFGDADLTGEKLARESMRTKARQLIEQIAPVEHMNWAMHLDQSLRTAIESAMKKDPGFITKISPYALGAGGAAAIGMGHGVMGGTMLAGALIRSAMSNPEVMTRLGIALDKAGVTVPKGLSNVGRFGPMLGGPGTLNKKDDNGPPGSAPPPEAGPPRQSVPKVFVNPF